MKYSRVHPYTAVDFLSRFAFLLIIPLLRQIFAQPQSFFQIVRTWGSNLLVTAAILLWAFAETRSQGYHAGKDRLFLRKGLLFKRESEIPYRNIHSVTVERSLLPAAFGAVRLRLDTPAGGKRRSDFVLTLFYRDFRRTVGEIFKSAEEKVLYCAGFWRLFLMSASWSNPAVGLILAAPFVSRLGKLLGEEISDRLYSTVHLGMRLAAFGIPPAAAFLAGLLASGWVTALFIQLYRYGGFTVSRFEETISIRRGLVSRRRTLVRADRISAVSVRQSLLMRFLRLYGAYLHTVGTGKERGDHSLLIAAAREEELLDALSAVTSLPLSAEKLICPKKKAQKSFFTVPLLFLGLCVLLAFLPALLGLQIRVTLLLLVFVMPFFAWWLLFRREAAKTSYLAVKGDALILSGYRRLTLCRASLAREKLQKIEIRQNPFQKRKQSCNVRAFLFSEGRETVQVKHLPVSQVEPFLAAFLEQDEKK